MERYQNYKNEFLHINQNILDLLAQASAIPYLSSDAFVKWRSACDSLSTQVKEELLRVAVVGSIKSGKSTFLNALFAGDYLKRGAGVVTSVITRIRSGKNISAHLYFKSLPEVNSEIEQALTLLPTLGRDLTLEKFDIRDPAMRKALKEALTSLPLEHRVVEDSLNLNTVLLNCYLQGFEHVEKMLPADNDAPKEIAIDFADHHRYVADDSLAVYLKDIQLEIDSESILPMIEFADCQGSDSPNPLHLAMIQDYMQVNHLMIYVISSRTGLRRADIKFLTMIRKMGIMDHVLFAVNCDMSEHESSQDLKALIGAIEQDLKLFHPDPSIYAFSALFNLFKYRPGNLPEKDRLRVEQWQKQTDLAEFSNRQSEKFREEFTRQLTYQRSILLLGNHLSRQRSIISGLQQWIRLNQAVVSRNDKDTKTVIKSIQRQQKRLNQIQVMIMTTLNGAATRIKKEVNNDVNRFFDTHSGGILKHVIENIRSYSVTYTKFKDTLADSGFTNALYLVFQEFKLGLDSIMADIVNPELIQFVRAEEEKIWKHFSAVVEPFSAIIQNALQESETLLTSSTQSDENHLPERTSPINLPGKDALLENADINPPSMATILNYSNEIKTDAIMHLGYYSVVRVVKNVFSKRKGEDWESQLKALQAGVKRMKRISEKAVAEQFRNYRENLKFMYLHRVIDSIVKQLSEVLLDQFQAYDTDVAALVSRLDGHLSDRVAASEDLARIDSTADLLGERVKILRDQIVN